MTAPEHAIPLDPRAAADAGARQPADGAHRGGPTDPSHDERLRRGILDTDVSRGLARVVTVIFVAAIFAVPVAQEVMQRARGEDSVLPDLFRHRPTRQSLRQFEEDLEQASYPKEWVQPRVQALLTGALRVGNKKAVVGREGWLYYEPGIRFVGGPGFLSPATIEGRERAAREAGGPNVAADPRPAILAFARALAARDIALVLFPVPDKAMLEPRLLHGRVPSGGQGSIVAIARNADWARFVAEMTAAGVTVFDPTPAALAAGEAPRYLAQDTHWTPAWMQAIAGDLARAVARAGRLAPLAAPPAWREVERPVTRVGDIVDMLKLPEGQAVFAPQTVTTRAVVDAAGADWEPDEKADVLLLGDSFTNVFSLDAMGWGTAAGLAPHLALALGRPVDVIAQNDSGAFATRQALSRELGGGHDRLGGKRVVVWELASRELAVGDWKEVPWPTK
jgi:alginate O-acetyltransferase complex protein AlgJ